jgi:eukaryotic-like serine/threonine-protein kinase
MALEDCAYEQRAGLEMTAPCVFGRAHWQGPLAAYLPFSSGKHNLRFHSVSRRTHMDSKTSGPKPANKPSAPASVEEASRLMETQAPASAPAQRTEARPASGSADLQSTQAHLASPVQQDTVLGGGTASNSGEDDVVDFSQVQQQSQPPAGAQNRLAATQAPSSATTPQAASKVKRLDKLGDYKLIKKLGAGGMGEVYKGHQESLDREVAIKVLFKHLASNADFVQRFQREARIMAKLDHPNILRCWGAGEEGGFHYLAMEFIDGGSMQDVLDKRGKLSVGDALHVILACARALQHAHESNMIHRDIKPDNILLTRKGIVKVADLGLAKAHGENVNLTRTGTGAGTPIYMSPEQARDAKHVDHRSDIYSLGCMLYAFLAGKAPFAGETYVELFEAKEKGRFEPARKSNMEIPDRMDLMIDKMLAKKVEQRYQSCADLIKDLEGLGLANASLSFIEGAVAAPVAPVVPTPARPATKQPAAAAGSVAKKTGTPATTPPSAAKVDKNVWYLSYHNSEGKLVRKKMTTDQVRDMIRDPDFDLKAQASHDPKEGYRALATYSEFEHALRGRLEKARADRKTSKFKDIYKRIEKEQEQYKRWRWFRDLRRNAASWVMFLIYLGVIGAVIAGGFFVVRNYLWDMIKSWLHLQ